MKKKIGLDFFKEYKNFADMQYNGGKLFSYVQYDTDVENNTYYTNLFLYDMEKEEVVKQLTKDNSVGMHQWIDQDNIAISKVIDPQDQEEYDKGIPMVSICKLNIHTGEYTKLCKINRAAYKFEYIVDDRFIFLCDESLMYYAYS